MTEYLTNKTAGAPLVSQRCGHRAVELIESADLAARWRVPVSWVGNRTRFLYDATEAPPAAAEDQLSAHHACGMRINALEAKCGRPNFDSLYLEISVTASRKQLA
jgi:hypothetical protein